MPGSKQLEIQLTKLKTHPGNQMSMLDYTEFYPKNLKIMALENFRIFPHL